MTSRTDRLELAERLRRLAVNVDERALSDPLWRAAGVLEVLAATRVQRRAAATRLRAQLGVYRAEATSPIGRRIAAAADLLERI